jgi:glycerol uptake facilitator-like aquaporin
MVWLLGINRRQQALNLRDVFPQERVLWIARAPDWDALVAALVWGIRLSLGGTTGYAINPARDFGPRLAHTLLPVANKGTSDWSYAIVPIVGSLIGGALAGGLMRAFGI